MRPLPDLDLRVVRYVLLLVTVVFILAACAAESGTTSTEPPAHTFAPEWSWRGELAGVDCVYVGWSGGNGEGGAGLSCNWEAEVPQ